MSTAPNSKTTLRNTKKKLSIGAAAVLALGVFATPALADNDRHRGWDRGGAWSGHHGHHRHHMPPGHAKKHHHHGYHAHGYYAPVYVYPPPVLYVPRPVYHAPSPGLTIVFPIDIN